MSYYLNEAALELIGRAAPSDAHEPFIALVHDLERTNQLAAANGQTSYLVDPRSQAFQFIESRYAAEVQSYRALENMNCLTRVVNGEPCEE